MLILGFTDYESQGRRLAKALGIPFSLVTIHKFPDGESLVTLPEKLSDKVIVCRSLDHPNEKLIELLLVAKAVKERGVHYISLVAPYLCYMRQDKAFNPGEVVSQQIIGTFLGGLVDAVITVDAHLHRINSLKQVIPVEQALNLSASPLMTDFLAKRGENTLLVGPDAESEQWVSAIAAPAGLDHVIANKVRLGDRLVNITLPDYDYKGRDVVLVDDMVSTGKTMVAVAEKLKAAGTRSINCLVTHALFTGDAISQLKQAGIEQIWSTDSISHPSNVIHLDRLLAAATGFAAGY